ncbi:MAG: cation-translocating P-type ATPase [Caldilinea sp.]|nr:cation-translocating P-type ATPase [Caldilineaceae bacterium]MCB9120715.1 cation-translocating P-type ATPase [Caldilineaceae bacterium]MCW5843425.1 cation-translocating P-type ATPase [Caldilinea sp.]
MSETQQIYRIKGMDCADCARTIEAGVARLEGVESCTLNYAAARLTVAGDIAPEVVTERVRALGYAVDDGPGDAAEAAPPWLAWLPEQGAGGFVRYLLSRRATAFALLGALLILPGLIFVELLPMLGLSSPLFSVTSLAALVVAGYPVARSAWQSLRINHRITINLLMTIAAIGAVIIGAYTEAGLVMVLFAIGEALEGYTMERARQSIRSLMEVAPAEALVLRPCIDCQGHMGKDGYSGGPCPFCGVEEQLVPVAELVIGDTIVVKPGERIPMDGRVTQGMSAVNQAPITGESTPVEKAPADEVFAGSINGDGALEVAVTHLAEDNTLSRIIRMVEEAQERKAPAERFVDQFARWYTPAVVVLAALVAVLPPLVLGAPFWGEQGWFYRALALLVIACPCALVISTPVTIISAISNAAHNGILIKGGAHLEALATLQAVAFDKTGTLTAGQPDVIAVRAVNCLDPQGFCAPCDDLLALASAVERRSEHPLARAIVRAAEERNVLAAYPAAERVTALPGRGVSGAVAGRQVVIGSHSYFDTAVAHAPEVCDAVAQAASRGHTPMLVGEDGAYRGYAVLADRVRPSSRAAIAALHEAGIRHTVMLTGDNAATARTIADAAGIDAVHADLMPAQKVEIVRQLLAEYGAVGMVGDGVNDAPALATATVGIAMGAGTAQALETADVALLGNDLGKLAYAVRLAQHALRTVRFNIALSIGIKLFFLALVLLGYGSLWLAVLADVGAALVVTLNGMRLLRWRGA